METRRTAAGASGSPPGGRDTEFPDMGSLRDREEGREGVTRR
ncbi:hypothetical protein GCM10022214_57030 [Actinomadura miaoliensis]|uniref:Uncharacterized protein n=1 Tax=Actinomadura miaoliensis TaxID=430685 RepID=A0ABP7WH87_9ACTN